MSTATITVTGRRSPRRWELVNADQIIRDAFKLHASPVVGFNIHFEADRATVSKGSDYYQVVVYANGVILTESTLENFRRRHAWTSQEGVVLDLLAWMNAVIARANRSL